MDFAYDTLPSLPEDDGEPVQPLLSSESLEWDAIANLDDFFRRIYKYYEEKGFEVILVSRVLNLLALAFTIAFSAFLLLFVKWHALRSECILKDTCDISEVAFDPHPLKDGFTLWNTLRVMYVAIFAVYWLYNLAHLFVDLREAAVISHFTRHRLGLSARQLKTVTWPEVARRIVDVQKQTRLCITRDLTEKDVVSRIMRKENYLIGMLNKGVLALNVTIPGLGKRFMLTKTLEWNLHWCILDAMLDDNFCIREDFKHDAPRLQRRFRRVAVANLLLAPFLLVFLLIYFFMRNAEKFYHQPSSAGARRWSSLAAWRLREFNELPHYLNHRLNASHKAAEKYIQQFPSPVLSHMAKFVAFLAGSFAALLLFMALVDDTLLDRHLFGRNLVWWAATLGIVLAVSRAFIAETGVAFEPELALLEVVAHTHWLPRHWRGRAHTQEVQQQFQELFQFKALLFLEEITSIVLTPFVLYFSLPKCAPAILAFVRDFSVHVPGVGDICSLGAFDFERHGNSKYGSPSQAPKAARSRQGKMEKSFLSFAATYPTWEPDSAAKQMLLSLGQAPPLRNGLITSESDCHPMQSAIAASLFPGAPRNPAYHNISPYSVAAAGSMHRLALRTTPGMASMQNSIFGSAEITVGAASVAASYGGNELEEKVAAGQLLLQSFYEDRERTMRLGGLHHARQSSARRDSGDLGRSGGGLGSSAAQRGSREDDAGFLLPRNRQDLASAPQEAHANGGSTGGPQQQQQAGMAFPREARPGRVQWAAEHGSVRPPTMNGRLPQIAEQEGLDAQRQLWRQPSGQPGSEGRAAGGLLGRTGLFRSRSSSDREEARASEMSFVHRGPSAQQEQPQQPRVEEPAHNDAHMQQEFRPEQGFGRGQDPLGAADQGHLAPDVPSWAQEGEELLDDFMLGSHHKDLPEYAASGDHRAASPEHFGHFSFAAEHGNLQERAESGDYRAGSPEHFGHLPFADEQGDSPHSESCSLHRDGAGSFDRGSAQLIGPPHGWHAQAELQSAHSGGLFEPLHEAMLEPHTAVQGSPGSSLTWHDDQVPSEGDLEAGFGGLPESSPQDRGFSSSHWEK